MPCAERSLHGWTFASCSWSRLNTMVSCPCIVRDTVVMHGCVFHPQPMLGYCKQWCICVHIQPLASEHRYVVFISPVLQAMSGFPVHRQGSRDGFSKNLSKLRLQPNFRPSLPTIQEDQEKDIPSGLRTRCTSAASLHTGPLPNLQRLLDATHKTPEQVASALDVPTQEFQDLLVGYNFMYLIL
jgi:hypothetical protein